MLARSRVSAPPPAMPLDVAVEQLAARLRQLAGTPEAEAYRALWCYAAREPWLLPALAQAERRWLARIVRGGPTPVARAMLVALTDHLELVLTRWP